MEFSIKNKIKKNLIRDTCILSGEMELTEDTQQGLSSPGLHGSKHNIQVNFKEKKNIFMLQER